MAKHELGAMIAFSVLILAYPSGHAASQENTPREKACSQARAKEQCPMDAERCVYKFTVKEVKGQKVKATYPPSVWSVTKKEEQGKDTKHKQKYEKHEFSIDLKQGSATPTVNKTYLFTKCPEKEFTLGEEISPNETHDPKTSKP